MALPQLGVILGNISSHENALHTAKSLLSTTVEPIMHEGSEMPTSLSFGVAMYSLDASNTEKLLQKADMDMYKAKRNDGNNYRFFSR